MRGVRRNGLEGGKEGLEEGINLRRILMGKKVTVEGNELKGKRGVTKRVIYRLVHG